MAWSFMGSALLLFTVLDNAPWLVEWNHGYLHPCRQTSQLSSERLTVWPHPSSAAANGATVIAHFDMRLSLSIILAHISTTRARQRIRTRYPYPREPAHLINGRSSLFNKLSALPYPSCPNSCRLSRKLAIRCFWALVRVSNAGRTLLPSGKRCDMGRTQVKP